MSGLFITGTGTEVGKTHVAALIARQLVAEGVRVGVYKPAASGCRRIDDELVADDAVALWEAAGRPLTLEAVCPQRFEAPLAPNVAAREAGMRVDAELLRGGLEPWRDFEFVLVEGAGGLMSPLSDADYNADLARDLDLPLVIVAANRLGVINDTLQTVITAGARSLPVAGVVLNDVTPTADESRDTNAGELKQRLSAPLVGRLSFGGDFDGGVAWRDLA
ncbi:ATP-dependent dethiobiotin synthetase BioD 1 [Planctomycetes bacterium MalM25]|nr:ATP-dependent dethiobiotin synthetase BioD 1 [Planctomycetes bacterium MalM25]